MAWWRVRSPQPSQCAQSNEFAADAAHRTTWRGCRDASARRITARRIDPAAVMILPIVLGSISSPSAAEGRRAGHRLRAFDWPGYRAQRHPAGGTLFRHARCNEAQPGPVRALVVAVVEPAERTRLVAGTGRSLTPLAGLDSTGEAAVDLAPVAMPAHIEDLAAPPASVLPKARFHGARTCANAGR